MVPRLLYEVPEIKPRSSISRTSALAPVLLHSPQIKTMNFLLAPPFTFIPKFRIPAKVIKRVHLHSREID